jgi:hypothetical protein
LALFFASLASPTKSVFLLIAQIAGMDDINRWSRIEHINDLQVSSISCLTPHPPLPGADFLGPGTASMINHKLRIRWIEIVLGDMCDVPAVPAKLLFHYIYIHSKTY